MSGCGRCGLSKSLWARLRVHNDGSVHGPPLAHVAAVVGLTTVSSSWHIRAGTLTIESATSGPEGSRLPVALLEGTDSSLHPSAQPVKVFKFGRGIEKATQPSEVAVDGHSRESTLTDRPQRQLLGAVKALSHASAQRFHAE